MAKRALAVRRYGFSRAIENQRAEARGERVLTTTTVTITVSSVKSYGPPPEPRPAPLEGYKQVVTRNGVTHAVDREGVVTVIVR